MILMMVVGRKIVKRKTWLNPNYNPCLLSSPAASHLSYSPLVLVSARITSLRGTSLLSSWQSAFLWSWWSRCWIRSDSLFDDEEWILERHLGRALFFSSFAKSNVADLFLSEICRHIFILPSLQYLRGLARSCKLPQGPVGVCKCCSSRTAVESSIRGFSCDQLALRSGVVVVAGTLCRRKGCPGKVGSWEPGSQAMFCLPENDETWQKFSSYNESVPKYFYFSWGRICETNPYVFLSWCNIIPSGQRKPSHKMDVFTTIFWEQVFGKKKCLASRLPGSNFSSGLPMHIRPTLAAEAILFESPCTAHSDT